jgi:hypothetical protein
MFNHIDYWSISPKGEFYLYRGLEDDLRDVGGPLKYFDVSIPVLRMIEGIAVLLEFSKAMKVSSETFKIHIKFKWDKLEGRELSTWSDQELVLFRSIKSHNKQFVSQEIIVPVDTAKSSIHQFVFPVALELFENFSGYKVPPAFVEKLATNLLSRRF